MTGVTKTEEERRGIK